MNPLITNEVLGTLALQATLAYMPDQQLNLTKALLILPLIYNKRIRGILKNKKVVHLSSRDLILSFPKDFAAVNNHYLDMSTTSINTILLACEMGVTKLNASTLILKSETFISTDPKSIGQLGSEIFIAAPRLAKMLEESSEELYQNFRIVL
ncbi:three component ABC system middle component [Pseudomonas protegens]|uniref:three component ABC system middle component n=1 Tax=Pseudomonas protegens TaxID=380021 RepID=UPI001F31259A|nr:three component ABC system middle component [Pseudomonas protegens]